MMIKLFNGRKGQVGNITDLIPSSLKFVFFIALIVVFGLILNPIFNSFGVFCKSDQTIVKVSESNLISNIGLISSLPSFDDISSQSIDPNGFFVKCTEYVNGSYRLLSYGCSDCDVIIGYTSSIDTTADVCLGDAFRTSDDDLGWFKRSVACPLSDCRIPKGYYYDVSSGLYECIDPNACTSQSLASVRDSKLDEFGAVSLYTSDSVDTDYRRMFRLSCTEKLWVQPTVFGLPIFNPAFWSIIILLIIIVFAIRHKKD